MKALITGASSGIGKDMAYALAKRDIDLCLVARRLDRLTEIKNDIEKTYNVNVEVYKKDLSNEEECFSLARDIEKIDILINNAGFGKFGKFTENNTSNDIELINLNVKALHILTKEFLKFMDDGSYILNVSSIAGHLAGGPLMASYYASKAYVLSLSQAINEELKSDGKKTSVSTFCPGPVNTEFNDVAGVKFNLSSISSKRAAEIAINKMFKRKRVILPSLSIKLSVFAKRFIPEFLMLKITHKMQKKKM